MTATRHAPTEAPLLLGALLAGGRSRRMGQDKALLPLLGKSLIEHSFERLRPQVTSVIIAGIPQGMTDPASADAALDDAALLGFPAPLLTDETVDLGPLSGVLTALRALPAHGGGATSVLTAPCDLPFLPHDLAARLNAASAGQRVVHARSQGRDHYSVALWPRHCTPALEDFLDSGARAVRLFLERMGAEAVTFPDTDTAPMGDPFFNINRPDDLVTAESWLVEPSPPIFMKR